MTGKSKILKAKIQIAALLCVLLGAALGTTRIFADNGADGKKGPEYVGAETCLSCHDGYDKQFSGTKHRMLFTDVTAKGPKKGCEACHGPASQHLDDPAQGVLRFESADPKKSAAACLNCHLSGDKTNWRVSTHATEDLTCAKCHSVHGKTKSGVKRSAKEEEQLLANGQLALCVSCHAEKLGQISMPSHHPVKEGKVDCSNCHSPHDNSPLQVEGAKTGCVKCHNEKAGPFKYEHSPVAEDCTTCHTPHGSVNQDLLTLRQPSLCLQCHASTPVTHNTSDTAYKKCTSCHVTIHGSNTNDKWF
jgi:DmsE family decaheme c-type cytochrome